MSEQVCMQPINDISFQHQYKIENNDEGITLLWEKQFSNSIAWLPSEGVRFLCNVYSAQVKYFAPSYDLTSTLEQWPVDPFAALNFLESTMQAAYQFFDEFDRHWWMDFFEEWKINLLNLGGTNSFEEFRCLLRSTNLVTTV
ncbi:hypothetical protein O6H91_21G069900 [Diphasiastrum complanatum]|uniref:Uncharacterized protein n=1 Tax=Diphasiastrum complanatum TaxID=34168 RepID=A0ACC2ALM3_DIPCM|nr:hypothetical protein O6H91_21G069900 [Diphasiastrum complanatum]